MFLPLPNIPGGAHELLHTKPGIKRGGFLDYDIFSYYDAHAYGSIASAHGFGGATDTAGARHISYLRGESAAGFGTIAANMVH